MTSVEVLSLNTVTCDKSVSQFLLLMDMLDKVIEVLQPHQAVQAPL